GRPGFPPAGRHGDRAECPVGRWIPEGAERELPEPECGGDGAEEGAEVVSGCVHRAVGSRCSSKPHVPGMSRSDRSSGASPPTEPATTLCQPTRTHKCHPAPRHLRNLRSVCVICVPPP